MARDHFIAKTYLKHFGDASRGHQLRAYRKSVHQDFPCFPADVCHEWDGDLNPAFLQNRPGMLGDFRAIFEPHWDHALAGMAARDISRGDKFAASGLYANLMTSTPGWRRLMTTILDHRHVSTLRFKHAMNRKHGIVNEELAEGVELLDQGKIRLETDPAYTKARLTRRMLHIAWLAYNQDWQILHNDTACPFVTSDNPVALLNIRGVPPCRFLTMTPKLCLRIAFKNSGFKPLDDHDEPGIAFAQRPNGVIRHTAVHTRYAKMINKLVVRCAEDLVFSSQINSGIAKVVRRNAKFRMEARTLERTDLDRNSMNLGFIVTVREP